MLVRPRNQIADASGDVAHRLKRISAQGGASLAAALRHLVWVADRGQRLHEVVGRGYEVGAARGPFEVRLDGEQGAAGVADEIAHRPLPEPGLVPVLRADA